MTRILNARILASLAMLVFVGAIVASATGAFFSDTETSTGNTFTAGSVTIAIKNIAHQYLGAGPGAPVFVASTTNGFSFSLSDLKPLDRGTVTYELENGANEAYVCAAVVETGNNDNGVNDPESDAGDVTPGLGEGELGQFLSFNFGSATGTLAAIDGNWHLIGTVAANGTASSSIGYCFGEYVGGVCQLGSGNYNFAQTDGLTADVHFYAVQTRNNPNFNCQGLPVPGGNGGEEPQTLVGSNFSSLYGPAPTCAATVSGDGSIQAAIDAAAADTTVCVNNTYTGTGDNSVIHVTKGIDLVALTQGIPLDVPVSLDADNTVVKGFAPTMGQIESPAEIAVIYVNGGVSNFQILSNIITQPGAIGGNVRGIVIETGASTGGVIENNTITNFTTGITLNTASNMTIRYNDIDGNTAGISYDGGAAVGTTNVLYNDFSGNTENVGYNAPNETVNLNFNNLPTGGVGNYLPGAGLDLNAANNWWGGDGAGGQTTGPGDIITVPEAGAAFAHN